MVQFQVLPAWTWVDSGIRASAPFVWEDVLDGPEDEHDEAKCGVGGVHAAGPVDDEASSAVQFLVAGIVPPRRTATRFFARRSGFVLAAVTNGFRLERRALEQNRSTSSPASSSVRSPARTARKVWLVPPVVATRPRFGGRPPRTDRHTRRHRRRLPRHRRFALPGGPDHPGRRRAGARHLIADGRSKRRRPRCSKEGRLSTEVRQSIVRPLVLRWEYGVVRRTGSRRTCSGHRAPSRFPVFARPGQIGRRSSLCPPASRRRAADPGHRVQRRSDRPDGHARSLVADDGPPVTRRHLRAPAAALCPHAG